ncbi:MAG: hypothetical protein F4213_16030 [Boseongicola sp. SB0677_bin_26]|nr:hypothetical protein [Boseongicola sp. SB0677_bin_26]
MSGATVLNAGHLERAAFVHGQRRQETVIENCRKRVRQDIMLHDPRDCKVLLRVHHEGYITRQQFAGTMS